MTLLNKLFSNKLSNSYIFDVTGCLQKARAWRAWWVRGELNIDWPSAITLLMLSINMQLFSSQGRKNNPYFWNPYEKLKYNCFSIKLRAILQDLRTKTNFLVQIVRNLPEDRFNNDRHWILIGGRSIRTVINELSEYTLINSEIFVMSIINTCSQRATWTNLCNLEYMLTKFKCLSKVV